MASTNYTPRLVDSALDTLMRELPAIMLTGPRGCGKTTTALQRAASVLRFDQRETAQAFSESPDAVLAAQPEPVLLDEWQIVPECMGAVKRAVDTGHGAGRFLITGSVRARLQADGWPATGRVVPIPLWGLTQGEIEQSAAAQTAITRLFGADDPTVGTLRDAPDLTDYVAMAVRGGFPDAVNLSDAARSPWYDGYIDLLVHHDVGELAAVRSPQPLAQLLRAVALNTAGLPTQTSLAQAADLTLRTAASYLDLLEDLRIIERLPAWGTNRLARLVKTPKYHVTDPGMAAHLAGDDRAGLLLNGPRLGRVIDTFVTAQIRPLLRLSTPSVTAHHLRDRNGDREVDLVLESAAGRVVGIEIKAANTASPHDARHLAWLRDQLGPSFARGVVVHTGAMTFPLGPGLWAMPIARLWRG